MNLIAGACLSLGMRFAGTAHKETCATLVRVQWGGGGGGSVFCLCRVGLGPEEKGGSCLLYMW